jgi:trimeric autotransporter adhesin
MNPPRMIRVTLSRNNTNPIPGAAVLAAALLWAGCLDMEDHPGDFERTEAALAEQETGRSSHALGGAIAQSVYAKSSNSEADDFFGVAIAVDGNTLVIGAPFEDGGAAGTGGDQNDDSLPDSGAVYIFRRTGAGWTQDAYLKAPVPHAGDGFGSDVVLSGNTLAVAAPFETVSVAGVGDLEMGGAVYVYRRQGGQWQHQARLEASNPDAFDSFGVVVALSGNTLAVGSFGESSAARGVGGDQTDNSVSQSGAVYVFRRQGGAWAQEAYIKASNTGAFDHFGTSLDLDGNILAIGAVNEGSSASGVDGNGEDDSLPGSGAVYVFRRQGGDWAQDAYIKAAVPGQGDFFGVSVSVSGNNLAVGAMLEDSSATGVDGDQTSNDRPNSGAAYLFRRQGGDWAQTAYLKASNSGNDDRFGAAVLLSGNRLAVGAPREASAATGVNGDQSDNSLARSGAAYLFRRTGQDWAQEAYVKASNPDINDQFGTELEVDGDTLIVGSPGEDSAATGLDGDQSDNSAIISGAAYIFE